MRWLMALALLAGCDRLPVRHELCGLRDGEPIDCDVTARFRDFKDCEFFNRYMSGYCDTASNPGHASCDFTQKSTFSVGRCVK